MTTPSSTQSKRTTGRLVVQALVVVAILLVGLLIGFGAAVITNQSRALDRRSVTIDYLRKDNAWAKCLLREDVGYKAAFFGSVIALQQNDEAEYERLTKQAERQLARYENIDKVCPPPPTQPR